MFVVCRADVVCGGKAALACVFDRNAQPRKGEHVCVIVAVSECGDVLRRDVQNLCKSLQCRTLACFGGGSNFGGIAFPFMRHNLLDGKKTRFIAAEPASCPKLTRGQFMYDFGDEAGYTPLLPMYTLGHNFAPANIHAGGLRYHGAGVIVSQLLKDKMMEAVDIQQLESFEAGILFARAEGIIPAPESCHAIAATIREANRCKETGEEKVILFNLSGHGLIDMASYDKYLAGDLQNYTLTDEDIQRNIDAIKG